MAEKVIAEVKLPEGRKPNPEIAPLLNYLVDQAAASPERIADQMAEVQKLQAKADAAHAKADALKKGGRK